MLFSLSILSALVISTPVNWKIPALIGSTSTACAFIPHGSPLTRQPLQLDASIWPGLDLDNLELSDGEKQTHNWLSFTSPFDWEQGESQDADQQVKYPADVGPFEVSDVKLLARVCARWRRYLSLEANIDGKTIHLLNFYMQNKQFSNGKRIMELGEWFKDCAGKSGTEEGAQGMIRLALIEKLLFRDLEKARELSSNPKESLEAFLDLSDDQVWMVEMESRFLLLQ
jgi:hypothetical protein